MARPGRGLAGAIGARGASPRLISSSKKGRRQREESATTGKEALCGRTRPRSAIKTGAMRLEWGGQRWWRTSTSTGKAGRWRINAQQDAFAAALKARRIYRGHVRPNLIGTVRAPQSLESAASLRCALLGSLGQGPRRE